MIEIKPQEGPQTDFTACEADICVFGGSAGGGKTFALLIDPMRHIEVGDASAVIFRRTTKQVRNQGSLWDASMRVYGQFGEPRESTLEWFFESGFKIQFAHLEYEKDVLAWQGAEVPWAGFDELTHFTRQQFFYMLSRLRSTSGVVPCIRATCNPDPDSWVAEFLSWWIDQDTGFPIPERNGVLRYFIRENDKIIWSDRKETPDHRSVTFIRSRLEDNKILMEKDPAYAANLNALSYVDRMQLKEGNWKVRPMAGTMFKREWFETIPAAPKELQTVRYWDRAATEPSEKNPEPAWTAGVKLGVDKNGTCYVLDVVRFRATPGKVKQAIRNTALQDGLGTTIWIEQDPGQAGVAEAQDQVKNLAGFHAKISRAMIDKVTRAKPVSAQAEIGNIKLLAGKWNQDFLEELQGFPDAKFKDQVDAFSGAYNMLVGGIAGDFTEEMTESNDTTVVHALDESVSQDFDW